MFPFPPWPSLAGSAPLGAGVAPFGYRRIKGCRAPPRRFSQPYGVLHRLSNARAFSVRCLSL
jgi:hypothetical protein